MKQMAQRWNIKLWEIVIGICFSFFFGIWTELLNKFIQYIVQRIMKQQDQEFKA